MKCLLVALLAAASVLTFELRASALPGTCECFASVCSVGSGGCIKSTACGLGYSPACRAHLDPAVCSFLVCTGVCDCAQIPGFCETVGGADYCADAGLDTGPLDTGTADTSVVDSTTADSGGDTRDGGAGDTIADGASGDTTARDTTIGDSMTSDLGGDGRLDTAVTDSADTGSGGDTGGSDTAGDTGSGDTGSGDTTGDTRATDSDGCVPLMCPAGTRAAKIPGECDPYCAQPCGSSEFKCSAYPGTECSDGFCVPKCLLTGCAACQRCNLSDGTCGDDPTRCDGGVSDTGDAGSDSKLEFDTAPPDATVGDTRDPFVDPDPDPFADQGCGCSVPANATDRAAAAAAGVALLGVLMTRRRRR